MDWSWQETSYEITYLPTYLHTYLSPPEITLKLRSIVAIFLNQKDRNEFSSQSWWIVDQSCVMSNWESKGADEEVVTGNGLKQIGPEQFGSWET